MANTPFSPNTTAVGCIGLGIMGAPAAKNMQRAGFALQIYARRPNTAADFADCRRYDSPKALGEKSDAVVLNVSDTPDVEELALGENGLIRGMKAGGIVIDMSTIAPAAARRIAAKLAEKEIYFLDAPVSGGQKGAVDGTLTIMAERTGFEPATSCVTGRRSNQLNYRSEFG